MDFYFSFTILNIVRCITILHLFVTVTIFIARPEEDESGTDEESSGVDSLAAAIQYEVINIHFIKYIFYN